MPSLPSLACSPIRIYLAQDLLDATERETRKRYHGCCLKNCARQSAPAGLWWKWSTEQMRLMRSPVMFWTQNWDPSIDMWVRLGVPHAIIIPRQYQEDKTTPASLAAFLHTHVHAYTFFVMLPGKKRNRGFQVDVRSCSTSS